MKKFVKYSSLCVALMLPTMMSAQTTKIDFETEDGYQSLGVYDTWPDSPFRTNQLRGNVMVIDNHLQEEDVNTTSKILGVQRSRFGSNTFGARIDLKQVIYTSPTAQYVHVMMHKPTDGRVMLIGLGKRTGDSNQSNDVEQFWVYPVNEVLVNEWFDAVFPVRTSNGVEIHSLVVVPHCEGASIAEDFAAYIDEIVINDVLTPRVGAGIYATNFPKDSEHTREDRWIRNVSLTSGDGAQSVTVYTANTASQHNMTAYKEISWPTIKAKAGQTVTPTIAYEGSWMHSYVYLDKGNDGEFSYKVDGSLLLDRTTDLMSFSYFDDGGSSGKNSAGNTVSNNNMTLPTFAIPSDLTPGIYRMRYKIDWNDIDPGGSIATGNHIISNGGGIVDVLLNIHGDQCNVNNDNRNGFVVAANATESTLSDYKAPFGQPFKIKMKPAPGFAYDGVRIRHGYNLAGDSIVKGNQQYFVHYLDIDAFDDNDVATIPAEYMDGDVLIEGLFVSDGNQTTKKKVTYNIYVDGEFAATQEFSVLPGVDYPTPNLGNEASSQYYSVSGMPEGKTTEEDEEFTINITQTLPFELSLSHEDGVWYNVFITDSNNPLIYTANQTYIPLTSTAAPAEDNLAAQWGFVGNVITGFQIINRGAGEGKILSAATNISSATDGTTYAIMRDTPVGEAYNTYWIPTVSTYQTGGFYLHQLGFVSNKMNSRDNRLAFWSGGADAGSTFTIKKVATTSGLTEVTGDYIGMPQEFYNLQGIRVVNPAPGNIYIVKQGSKVTKVLM